MARPCTRTLRLRSRETWAASSLKASWQTNRCGLLALRSKWRGPSRLITEEVSRHNPSNAFLCARRPKYQVMVDGDVEQSSSSSLSRIKDTDIRFGSCTASQPGLRVLFRDRPTVTPPHGHPQHRGHLRRRVPRSLLIDERGLITHHDQTNTRGCPSAQLGSHRFYQGTSTAFARRAVRSTRNAFGRCRSGLSASSGSGGVAGEARRLRSTAFTLTKGPCRAAACGRSTQSRSTGTSTSSALGA